MAGLTDAVFGSVTSAFGDLSGGVSATFGVFTGSMPIMRLAKRPANSRVNPSDTLPCQDAGTSTPLLPDGAQEPKFHVLGQAHQFALAVGG